MHDDVGDDYLWDRRGRPDPEVQRLEALLSPLGHAASAAAPVAVQSPVAASPARRRAVLPAALAASLIAAVGVGWMVAASVAPRPAWEVSRLSGAPTIGSRAIAAEARLPVGEWLETGAAARARVMVGRIGVVDLDPHSRLRLSNAEAGRYRLRLARGTLRATIWAPPGQFAVDTPSSTAVDLGCAYTLTVADDGAGVVTVTSGWVAFEWQGRESFIPAGTLCATRPGIGPGTPHYAGVSPAFQAALGALDFEPLTSQQQTDAVSRILADAAPADALTLWHLLPRVEVHERDRLFDRLASVVPPPAGVTREGIRSGRRDMLDRWWDELGFGSMQFWRRWQQGWRDTGG